MAKLEITNDMLSGFKIIDDQHLLLIKLVNSLYIFDKNSNLDEVKQLIERIVKTATCHFKFEESLMMESDYQYSKAYISIHSNLVKRVAKLYDEFNNGKYIIEELRELLTSWLKYYVKIEASTYVEHIVAHFNAMDSKRAENKIKELLYKCELN